MSSTCIERFSIDGMPSFKEHTDDSCSLASSDTTNTIGTMVTSLKQTSCQKETVEGNIALVGSNSISMGELAILETFYHLAKLQDSSAGTLRLLMRAVRMLQSCGYDMLEICLVLAHTSVYFNDLVNTCEKMGTSETGHIVLLLMYMANSYVQDDCPRLSVWHQYLFNNYCSLLILNKALMSTMQLRDYTLRIDDSVLQERLELLIVCTQ